MTRRFTLLAQGACGLPDAYRRVAYIAAEDANPYIDTGLFITGELQAKIHYYNSKVEAFLFGSRKSSSGPYCNFNIDSNGSWSRFDYLSKWYGGQAGGFGNGTHDGEFLFTFKDRSGVLAKTDSSLTVTKSYSDASFPAYTDHSVLLFAAHTGSAVSLGAAEGSLRVYSAKFWLGGTYANGVITGAALARNFIPCIRIADDKPGMWDTVTRTFFTNAGAGEFAVPA